MVAIILNEKFIITSFITMSNLVTFITIGALLSFLLDSLEGLGMMNCRKLELGAAPDFQH